MIIMSGIQSIANYLGVLNITAIDWLEEGTIKEYDNCFGVRVEENELKRVKDKMEKKGFEEDLSLEDEEYIAEKYAAHMLKKIENAFNKEGEIRHLTYLYSQDINNLRLRELGISNGELWLASDGNTYFIEILDNIYASYLIAEECLEETCPFALLAKLSSGEIEKVTTIAESIYFMEPELI